MPFGFNWGGNPLGKALGFEDTAKTASRKRAAADLKAHPRVRKTPAQIARDKRMREKYARNVKRNNKNNRTFTQDFRDLARKISDKKKDGKL